MKSTIVLAGALLVCACAARAQTLCGEGEINFFSCALTKKDKIVSLCGSKDLSRNAGYLQYRFGTADKIEMTAPKEKAGAPAFELTRSKDAHAEYDSFHFEIDPFVYELTSFRQFTPKNGDGYPTPPSSDSLSVRDNRKSMKEGDVVFSSDCKGVAPAPVDIPEISKKTGASIQKAGF
jgi:hypothetical protein